MVSRFLIVQLGCCWLGLTMAATGCFGAAEVKRGEFDSLTGRVANLENLVVGPPGGVAAPAVAPTSGAPAAPGAPAVSSTAPSGAARAPAGENAAYQRGQSLLKQKNFTGAAAIFTEMLNRDPGGRLAPNARYWLGECWYATGQYREALVEFERCLGDYPASNKAPDALLKMAYCHDRLGDGGRAMASLEKLLRDYPASPAAVMVKSGRGRFKNS